MNQKFTTVAVFSYSSEAKIIRGRLEADGIQTFLSDELTIDTDPLVSNAIGGIKLKVLTEDVEKAREVLDSISAYSLTNEGEKIICPNCESTKINYFTHIEDVKSLMAFIFGFLFGGLPFHTKYEYKCEICKSKFSN
ncbi:hypothetical protein ULMA_24200 [Patiriisocius marinus]|uniref:Uncharacterized protein n=1 Tax=Patiriisocius marinus TaxID=1397112 RepID=A0A5J4J0F6_9FLAO|nr:DUF2007 domain-containing protein [Patiriisocius marinus]GER60312.1 hypothetical protein ULMA_24200 [Patiriisocius marinus]